VGAAALQGDRWAAEAVIDPQHRGRGLGRGLVTALDRAARDAGGDPWFWSHGDHPAAAHLAASAGFSRSRELLQLTTDGVLEVPVPQVPDGVLLRDVRPEDAEAWAAVNNAAFSWHPEQGRQDPADYRARLTDPDADLGAVVIAERTEDGRVLGFHETKMHAAHPSGLRMGEVHVIGVDPDVHARGVGRALLLEGMRRMVERGAEAIELYVESDNEKALPLYRDVGFSRTVVHVSFQPPEDPHAA
jgi:mycothiol synthase